MNDMPDFDDSDLPDFDSMSQEELIHWLEQLAKRQSDSASAFIGDFNGDLDELDSEALPADEDDAVDWSEWLNDTEPVAEAPPQAGSPDHRDHFPADEDDTPVDLSLFDEEDTAPTAAMDWLDAITAQDDEADLPDISQYRPPEAPRENLADLLSEGEAADPLDWLDSLASEVSHAAAAAPPSADRRAPLVDADDFDDSYEDDETLDDLEDESLYSLDVSSAARFLESLLGLDDRDSERGSTQSMPPVPDFITPSAPQQPTPAQPIIGPRLPQQGEAERGDSLPQAFMLQDQHTELEAWYAGRLRAIARSDRPQPASAPPQPAAKPPPPGLAAAIYSARGKVKADDLRDALADYETLLRTNAGLEWVVGDMRALIEQERFSHNPSVHRVLGDALMRQGHLDAALDVYRHALSLL